MIKIWNWFKSLFVAGVPQPEVLPTDESRGFITYKIDSDNTVRLSCHMVTGQEAVFAELLFNINSGILLRDTLEIINNSAMRSGTGASCQKMVEHLTDMYRAESDARLQDEEEFMDESIINPSDVFNSNDKDE